MTKKLSDQNMSYREDVLNSIEPNFIFSKKPINRFKIQKTEDNNNNLDKSVMKIFDVVNSVNLKTSYGGTSTKNIKKMILKLKKELK